MTLSWPAVIALAALTGIAYSVGYVTGYGAGGSRGPVAPTQAKVSTAMYCVAGVEHLPAADGRVLPVYESDGVTPLAC